MCKSISLRNVLFGGLVMACFAAMPAPRALASLEISFSDDGSVPVFFADGIGVEVIVPLFVRQTGTTDTLSTTGLTAYGLTGSFNGELASANGFTAGTGFIGGSVDTSTAGVIQFSGFAFAPVTATNNAVALGNLSLTTLGPGSFELSFTDRNATTDDFTTTGPNSGLDALIFQDSTGGVIMPSVTITAVPEPATFAFLGAVGTGVVSYRRLRRKSPTTPGVDTAA